MIETLGITSILMLIFVLCIWGWYLHSHNPSIVDVCWSIGIFLSGSINLFMQQDWQHSSIRSQAAWFLLLTWATRLASYLWLTRIAKNHQDPRYETLSKNWQISKHFGFLLNYTLQGFLMMIVALPFLFIPNNLSQYFSIVDYFAVTLIIIALFGEGIADWQLNQFKKHSPKMVCNVGLWQYSRHPNYFFEWLIWIGFSLLAINSAYGYVALISPLVLLAIFVFITGPITERQSLKSRGEAFVQYQKSTSFIVPWFKKM